MKATSPTQEIPVASPVVRILKAGTCPSLSGKSTLTYHVGCDAKSEIQLRVFSNSAAGFFSKEWIAFSTIEKAFAKVPSEQFITAYLLYPLFQGKSINTPAFLFSALKNEGLVQPAPDKKRNYERLDPSKFIAEVKALIASGVDMKVEDKSRKVIATPAKATSTFAKAQQGKSEAKPEASDAKVTPASTGKKGTGTISPQAKPGV